MNVAIAGTVAAGAGAGFVKGVSAIVRVGVWTLCAHVLYNHPPAALRGVQDDFAFRTGELARLATAGFRGNDEKGSA